MKLLRTPRLRRIAFLFVLAFVAVSVVLSSLSVLVDATVPAHQSSYMERVVVYDDLDRVVYQRNDSQLVAVGGDFNLSSGRVAQRMVVDVHLDFSVYAEVYEPFIKDKCKVTVVIFDGTSQRTVTQLDSTEVGVSNLFKTVELRFDVPINVIMHDSMLRFEVHLWVVR